MPYIASTLSTDQAYTDWTRPDVTGSKVARPAAPHRVIVVKGKANVTTKHMVIPEGILTSVTDDELEALQKIKAFQDHLARGHLKILAREVAPDKVARDMKDRDESAPLSEAKGDFKKGTGRAGGLAPKGASPE